MAFSRVSYTGNGDTSEFTIPFPLLRVDTLQVRTNNILRTLGTDYTVDTSTSKVVFTVPPAPDIPVVFQRVTPRGVNDRLVKFTDPSDIRADILNAADLQLLYILQEALDDIEQGVGVGNPTGPTDPEAPLPPNVVNALDAAYSELHSALSAEVSARAAALLAEASARSAALAALQGTLAGQINSVDTTRGGEIATLNGLYSALDAAVGHPTSGLSATRARLITEESTRAAADSAAATRLSALESTVNNPSGGVGNLAARLSTVEGTLTGGNSNEALAFRVTNLESQASGLNNSLNTLTSRVSTEETTRANADNAIGQRVTNVESSVGSLSASVSSASSTFASASGSLAAEHVLHVVTNDGGEKRIAGFRVTNLGGGSPTEFAIQADKFKVVNSSGTGAIIPFIVSGGVTYIDEAVIQSLNVAKLTGGTITGKQFVLAAGSGGQLTTFQTSNYIPNVSGLCFRSDGYIEGHKAFFRDSIITGTLGGVSLSPAVADFETSQEVSAVWPENSTLRYTLDGSEVTSTSAAWPGTLTVSSSSLLRVRAFSNSDGRISREASGFYIKKNVVQQKVATPVVTSLIRGTGDNSWNVSLGCATPSASIEYRVTGLSPQGWTAYSGPLLLPGGNTIHYRAKKVGLTDSDEGSTYLELWAPNPNGGGWIEP